MPTAEARYCVAWRHTPHSFPFYSPESTPSQSFCLFTSFLFSNSAALLWIGTYEIRLAFKCELTEVHTECLGWRSRESKQKCQHGCSPSEAPISLRLANAPEGHLAPSSTCPTPGDCSPCTSLSPPSWPLPQQLSGKGNCRRGGSSPSRKPGFKKEVESQNKSRELCSACVCPVCLSILLDIPTAL